MSGMPPDMTPAQLAEMEKAFAKARVLITTMWTLYAFGAVITMLRTYARIKAVGWKRLDADDYLVWLALVSATDHGCIFFHPVC